MPITIPSSVLTLAQSSEAAAATPQFVPVMAVAVAVILVARFFTT